MTAGAKRMDMRLPPSPDEPMIVAGDLNVDIGAYGAPVRTPNIDALTAQRFRMARRKRVRVPSARHAQANVVSVGRVKW